MQKWTESMMAEQIANMYAYSCNEKKRLNNLCPGHTDYDPKKPPIPELFRKLRLNYSTEWIACNLCRKVMDTDMECPCHYCRDRKLSIKKRLKERLEVYGYEVVDED